MDKEKQMNYFIIKRLDSNEGSDNFSSIYDLSILNHIKEKKPDMSDKRNKMMEYFRVLLMLIIQKKLA